MAQKILHGSEWRDELSQWLSERKLKKILLVCGGSYDHLSIRGEMETLPVVLKRFSGFSPNPKYEEVCEGVEMFQAEGCDGILAVGGGSAMDVAKCVKLYCRMDPDRNYLEQEPHDAGIPLIAVPTTAGTGSESTRFAVIYYRNAKQSVAHDSILPDVVVLEPAVLERLPLYQKKSTMLDALCQGIESWWSIHSTEESMDYAKRAIECIRKNWRAYIVEAEPSAAAEVMWAANLAGRAINITQTTAPHAMSYKLTSLYGLPHGHAVAVCLPEVWEYMLAHTDETADERGPVYLQGVFEDIAAALGCTSAPEAIAWFRDLLASLEMGRPADDGKLDVLAASVNPVRLKNSPVPMSGDVLRGIYGRILEK